MKKYNELNKRHNMGKSFLVRTLTGVLFLAFCLFITPVMCIQAAEQGQWSYDDEEERYCYIDKNGWKFQMDDKTDTTCTLISVPDDWQGELNIPSKIRLDSVVREVDLSYYFVVPKGVTKVYLPDLSDYNEENDYPYESCLYWFDDFSDDDENALTVCCYEGDYYKKYLERFSFKVEYLDPATAEVIGGEAEDNWSYDADKELYFYTDEQGFQYSFDTKEAEDYVLCSIPADAQGEIAIPSEITVDGKIRKLHHLDSDTLQIPSGVTKVTFGKGIFYISGPIFDKCSPDLVVSGYLDDDMSSILAFAKSKGLKMEYLNGYTDQNGIIYYVVQPAKGKVTGAVYGYAGTAENITIESEVTIQGVNYPVTYIGKGAFANTKVKKVTLPDTITSIDFSAFEGCKALTSVKLSKKLTDLGHSAFAGCTKLTSIEIPSGVTYLYTSTFSDCTGLKKITLSKNLKGIGDYVFYNCKNLATINVKNLSKLESIASESFYGCKKLTSLTFGKKLKNIGAAAFYKCTALKTVTLQSTSMQYIGEMAFYGDSKLKTITIKATNLSSKKLGKNIFKGTSKKMVVKVPSKKVTSYKKLLKKYGNTTIVVKK